MTTPTPTVLWRTWGKHLGMFVNKSEIKQSTTFQGIDEAFTPNVDEDIKRLANISGYSVIKGGKE